MAKQQKQSRNKIWQKVKETLTKRSFIGSFVFAIALWGYASLNGDYVTLISIPLSTVLPENRALEQPLPEEVSVKVEGTGWNLFNLNFLKSSAQCEINLSDKNINDSLYLINRSEIITSISGLNKFEPRDVYPDNFLLKTGKISEYEVPVISTVELNTFPNYKIVGDIIIKPETIKIRGNEKLVKNINFWNTEYLQFDELNSDITINVPLKDTLSDIISLSTDKVEIKVAVEQMAELILEDVPLVVKGGKMSEYQFLYPSKVKLIIQGGVHQLQKINKERVLAYVNYNDLISDSTGILKTYADIPDDLKLLSVEPQYVYHYIERKGSKFAKY